MISCLVSSNGYLILSIEGNEIMSRRTGWKTFPPAGSHHSKTIKGEQNERIGTTE